MRLTLIALAMLSCAGSPSLASEDAIASVTQQVRECLVLTPYASRNPYRIKLHVDVVDSKPVSVKVVSVEPNDANGQAIADAAVRATNRCIPYEALKDGEATLVFAPDQAQ